ncbi:hypothetical protein EWI07_02530 [Sporolactobacillus sp. THM7-4]|nr:hypothetical protein EWI07_02530 [Sporolactobacillus sp. THM7-4]
MKRIEWLSGRKVNNNQQSRASFKDSPERLIRSECSMNSSFLRTNLFVGFSGKEVFFIQEGGRDHGESAQFK